MIDFPDSNLYSLIDASLPYQAAMLRTFGEKMKSGDKTLIALIALLLFSSLVSPVSKVFFADSSVADQARNLQEQIAEIEMRLKNRPDEVAGRALIEAEILEVREKTERIIAQEDAKSRLHWWNDILFPLIMLLFLVYLGAEKRRTEQGDAGKPDPVSS